MNRELPYSIGTGDHERAHRMAAVAMAHSVACAIVALVGFGLFIPWSFTNQTEWRWPLIAMALVASSNFYYGYIQSTLRSATDFQRLGRLQLIQAMLVTTQPLLAWQWGFPGFCAHAAAQAVLLVLLAHRIRPFRVAPHFDTKIAATLLATGVPLFLGSYLQMLAGSLDRIVLLRSSGIEALGYFAPAVAAFGAMTVVPGSLTNYFYPKLSFEAGRGDSRLQLWHSVTFAVSRSVLLMAPLLLIGWFVIPPLVDALIPAYTRSVPAMQVALLSGIALAAATCTTLLGVLKAWRSLYLYLAVLLVSKAIFTTIGSRHDDPILGVAIGSALSLLLSAGLSVWLVYRATHLKPDRSRSTP